MAFNLTNRIILFIEATHQPGTIKVYESEHGVNARNNCVDFSSGVIFKFYNSSN